MTQAPHDGGSWRQIDWDTIEAEMVRITAELAAKRAVDNAADRSIMSFIVELEDVALGFARRSHLLGINRAARPADHIAEFERVLSALLDLLSDWEAAAKNLV